jgi:hypothetical protein
MSIFNRAADIAHKATVLGLVSLFGFQLYQIGRNISHGVDKGNQHPQKEYIETLREKAEEDYKKHYKIDHRDWYSKDDDSYLQNAPKANGPNTKD